VQNETTGVIESGSGWGVFVTGSSTGTVENAGTIGAGGDRDAVYLGGGGSVRNEATGVIEGGSGRGVFITGSSAGTVENAGTIGAAAGSDAVYLGGGGTNRLIVDAGAEFQGTVKANPTATNTIELTSSSSAGTLAGLGSEYVNFHTVTIDSGAAWTITGPEANFSGVTIAGFNRYDTLDLTNLGFQAGDTASVNGADQLVVYNSGHDPLASIQLSGNFSGYNFKVATDRSTGTDISGSPPKNLIPGTYSSGIVLSSPNYLNPVTVTATGNVSNSSGNALYAATSWTVTNSGTVSAPGYRGIYLKAGGVVTNASGGLVNGKYGIAAYSGTEAVANAGTISGASSQFGFGVSLEAGGSVTNQASGTISGGTGIYIGGGLGTVINVGSVGASAGYGIWLLGGGTVRNETGGAITNSAANFEAVVVDGAFATVANAGTIADTASGRAVVFTGNVSNRLIVDPGAVFKGTVSAGSLGTNTIELTSTAAAGTLTGLGSEYVNFHTVTIDSGAAWTISGTHAAFGGVTVNGFSTSDKIDLTDLQYATGDKATWSADVLTIANAGGTTLDTLNLDGSFAGEYFHLASDGGAGMNITESSACYLRGTQILTERGQVAVEDLQIGDHVLTLSGKGAPLKPIVWIGRSSFDASRHSHPEKVLPIRILEDAFGHGMPCRDLLVSPDHAFPIDGCLIPAQYLVNGATIMQDLTISRGVYFHIELKQHDIVLSEGLPAETYLECNNRHKFDNQPGFRELYPDFTEWREDDSAEFVLPLTRAGDALTAARAKLQAQAEALRHALTDDGPATRSERSRESASVASW
jgi:hypothetical protein